jgi:Protein of unknown function (DUF3223)
MSRAISVTIGGFVFSTKKAAQTEIRRILNDTTPYEPLQGDDHRLIRGLLDLHHDAAIKLAGGCVAIRVQWNKLDGCPPTRGFHVVREDGSTIDFSIYCGPFEPETETKRRWAKITQAARFAVRDRVAEYKSDYFNGADYAPCELTGVTLHWDDAVTDHGATLAIPTNSERLAHGPRRRFPKIVERQFGWELPPVDRAAFIIFHDERARLRVIDKTQNMRLGDHGHDQ